MLKVREGASEAEYLTVEAVRNAARLIRARVRRAVRGRNERRPDLVRRNYDAYRSVIPVTDYEEFVFGPATERDHVLIDDRVVWASSREAQKIVLPRMSDAIASYVRDVSRPTIVEFGCGRGRNLFFLKKRNPTWRLIGLDISPASIELSKRAAEQFDLDVEFHVADVTASVPELPADVDVCFSSHALEQMPRIFKEAVATMRATARRAVIFFEPVGELYPKNLRGVVARARLVEHDYLDGLYDHLKEVGANVVRAERMRTATNPLNETVEIHVVP